MTTNKRNFLMAASSSIALLVSAGSARAQKTIEARKTFLSNIKDFGAVGDGRTDDTKAWEAFQVAPGLKFISAGKYRVKGELKTFRNDVIGDGNVSFTDLTAKQQAQVSVDFDITDASNAKICVTNENSDSQISPALIVASKINDSSGDRYGTKIAGIFSYIEQTGSNTNQYVKSICGTSVNAASGNNDSTAVVGYSYKLDVVGGIGDACGTGGASWQYSTNEGLVLGGEFSAHQNVPGTRASNYAKNGNNTISLHVTTNSIGARCFSGISLDTFGRNDGRYGFWNALHISGSCFAAGGQPELGTVGINFANNTNIYPDKAIYLGNANHHLYRSNASIRVHCDAFDIENSTGGSVGVRLITPSENRQNVHFSAYTGNVAADGGTVLTPGGGLEIDSSGHVHLTAYRGGASDYTGVSCSPNPNAFYPSSSDGSVATSLGTSSNMWSHVFAGTGAISTSDERFKTNIESVPEAILDAWGEVEIFQYQFKDASERKDGDARRHTGIVAQKVLTAFQNAGLDVTKYGLFCYDEWGAVEDAIQVDRVIVSPMVADEDGTVIEPAVYEEIETVTPGVPAGNRYGIRYEEALCLEAAYQRRRADMLEARLAAVESKVEHFLSKA